MVIASLAVEFVELREDIEVFYSGMK